MFVGPIRRRSRARPRPRAAGARGWRAPRAAACAATAPTPARRTPAARPRPRRAADAGPAPRRSRRPATRGRSYSSGRTPASSRPRTCSRCALRGGRNDRHVVAQLREAPQEVELPRGAAAPARPVGQLRGEAQDSQPAAQDMVPPPASAEHPLREGRSKMLRARSRAARRTARGHLRDRGGLGARWSPPGQVPDEPNHIQYTQTIAERYDLPGHGPNVYSVEQGTALGYSLDGSLSGIPGKKPPWTRAAYERWQHQNSLLELDPNYSSNGGGYIWQGDNPPLYYAYEAAAYRVGGRRLLRPPVRDAHLLGAVRARDGHGRAGCSPGSCSAPNGCSSSSRRRSPAFSRWSRS